jgi:MinD-like ATPase involved in chromosome partitioning or flagellar assembly
MQLVIIDTSPPARAALLGRVQEASRQAGLQRIAVIEVDPLNLDDVNWSATIGCFVGSGCGTMLKDLLSRLQGAHTICPMAIVLDVETYASEAVAIHKILGREVIAETDLTQMANFIVDCERAASGRPSGVRSRHIIGVTQLKGGVGATSLTAALGVCWSTKGKTVALLDFDDVSPQLTEWACVPQAQRTLTGELLRTGEVTIDRLRDFVHPIEGFGGRLVAVGQPLQYSEAFHFRAYVMEGAPSASEFVSSMLSLLSSEYDIVLIDLGRSWGVSTFAALPWCEKVVFVMDDDGISVRRSLDSLARLKQESGDPDEFNLNKWVITLNKVTGQRLSDRDIGLAVEHTELFPKNPPIVTIPYTERGRQWGATGTSMYTLSESRVKASFDRLAETLVPDSQTSARRGALPSKLGFGRLWGRDRESRL